MEQTILKQALWTVLAPLVAALLAGIAGKQIGKRGAHGVTITGVAIATWYSLQILVALLNQDSDLNFNFSLYTWADIAPLHFEIGFMLDRLTAVMMLVVSSVSLMVHIYSMGYMQTDPGYQRFFCYISLFTFAMLVLVMANNFLQLFFGWEAVGLMSYLLIGFWHQRETAVYANLKAFLVNRVGDFGFLLGIAGILYLTKSLDYATVFANLPANAAAAPLFHLTATWSVSLIDLSCLLLFMGAMGKSAQIPLHVWLPDSMEGPTPISALIHAATMVTAGVFMLARLSPIFEYSAVTLNFILIIGAMTCFFMGLIGLVSHDIKRIIAYSTLSQLGYMMVACGASAYGIAVFHLMTHAFFKALLFLGAGSVIIAVHHQQDIWKMGGLRHALPITYSCMLIGTLALVGVPFLSGFYSKESIIEVVKYSDLPAASWAYCAVLSSVLITSLYSFRLLFVVFHGSSRGTASDAKHLHKSAWPIWAPLVALAIPSIGIGGYFIHWLMDNFFGTAIFIAPTHTNYQTFASHFSGWLAMGLHGLVSLPFALVLLGAAISWLLYVKCPQLPAKLAQLFKPLYWLLQHKYGFDLFNQWVLMPMTRGLGWICWRIGDKTLIDGLMVNGSARMINRLGKMMRTVQSGYIYHYALAMVLGLLILLLWLKR